MQSHSDTATTQGVDPNTASCTVHCVAEVLCEMKETASKLVTLILTKSKDKSRFEQRSDSLLDLCFQFSNKLDFCWGKRARVEGCQEEVAGDFCSC